MRMLWLDCFRGVAALIVVVFHFHMPLGIPELHAGFLAVDLFFVLSGIVLGLKYAPLIEGGMTFGQFAWQRLRRLYPMALIVTALVLAMNALAMPRGVYIPSERSGWVATLFITPLPGSWGNGESFPPDGAMYSLWAELVSNAVWFAALRAGRKWTIALFCISIVVFSVIAQQQGGLSMGWQAGRIHLMYALLRALAWFGVGYFVARRQVRPFAPTWALAIVLVSCGTLFQYKASLQLPLSYAIVLTGTALLINLMHREPKNARVAKVCAWLGLMSYPMYLIHVPSGRIALWLVSVGGNPVVSHIAVFAIAALAATVLNEAIVRRIPRHAPFGAVLQRTS